MVSVAMMVCADTESLFRKEHKERMDKKEKKRMEVLQQKIAKLQHLLAGAKQQPDDPTEAPRLEKELAAAHAELAALKKA